MPSALVFAPDWPGFTSGSAIALRSSLLEYIKYFRRIRYVSFGTDTARSFAHEFPTVEFLHLPVRKLKPSLRFLASLPSKQPAITHHYRRRNVKQAAQLLIHRSMKDGFRHLVIESLGPFGIIENAFPTHMNVAFRSFDVMHKAFEEVGKPYTKALWAIESQKIKRLEESVCAKTTCSWAICPQDYEEYRSAGLNITGILGVSIDTLRYKDIAAGHCITATHLGSTDDRKRAGINLLVETWPTVRAKHPGARLLLGGIGTERYTNLSQGIIGCGYVEDDRTFLGQGKVAISSQIGGSGVKLKSLNALAASRVLVSSPDGLRGVGGAENKHYLVYTNAFQLCEKLCDAFNNNLTEMQNNARKHIADNFSPESLSKHASVSLQKYASE